MLRRLRKLLEPERAAPQAGGGKLTLRDVLLRDWDELWYQPKIELRTKRLVGAEGLLRARRPDGSIVAPGDFLPGSREEEMLALTERVILTALRDFEDYAVQGASVKLSVNVPVSALVKLPLARMLREHRPPTPNWPGLILEVTEDEILHDLKLANDVAEELRSLRCTLALDDFGAGYSSLARLRQLPFSELKIDRSYVSNCHDDKVNGGLCETIVKLAKRFELMTVAEGIEKSAESDKLKAIGCDIGQGYLFAKPMPKAEFVAALGRRLVGPPKRPAKPRVAVTTLTRGALADT
jgi:EAL domain-containing protein (putative c-di-GMP-specific phosphodiesterase class I)